MSKKIDNKTLTDKFKEQHDAHSKVITEFLLDNMNSGIGYLIPREFNYRSQDTSEEKCEGEITYFNQDTKLNIRYTIYGNKACGKLVDNIYSNQVKEKDNNVDQIVKDIASLLKQIPNKERATAAELMMRLASNNE